MSGLSRTCHLRGSSNDMDSVRILSFSSTNLRHTCFRTMRSIASPLGRRDRLLQPCSEYQPRSSSRTEQPERSLPPAPPTRAPPPPPPPPPSPSADLSINVSRRALLGIMIGGTVAWYAALKYGVPMSAIDRRRGVALLRTKGGNLVGAAEDESGRLFLFDKAGNLYYDTEDPALGIYIVDTSGNMYNEYLEPGSDEIKRVPVGNIADITSVKVSEIGGVPIEELQNSVRGFRGGRVVGFAQPPDENGLTWENMMPPNAPATVPRDGGRIRPPPMLEDYEVDLEPRNRDLPSDLDDTEIIRSLRIER